MESLEFRLNAEPAHTAAGAALCGVVGSGNLEILIQPGTEPRICNVSIKTSARGFQTIWEAVLTEFSSRHAMGGTSVSINDLGATPAVVTLRLGQALSHYTGNAQ